MKRTSSIFFVFMIVCAIIASLIGTNIIYSAKNEAPVVVVTKPLPAFKKIEESDVTVKEIPVKAIHADTFKDPKEVIGKYTSVRIEGDFTQMRKNHLVNQASSLAGLLRSYEQANLVAVSIPMNPNDMGQQIQAGDRVHLLGVFREGQNIVQGRYVARDVAVLFVENKENQAPKITVAIPDASFPDIGKALESGSVRIAIQSGKEK